MRVAASLVIAVAQPACAAYDVAGNALTHAATSGPPVLGWWSFRSCR